MEQIEDIEDRMQSLGGVFASQVDDQESEEKVRREVLIGFVLPLPEAWAHFQTCRPFTGSWLG